MTERTTSNIERSTLKIESSTLKIENNVAWLTLNRPQLRNAFDDMLIAELSAHLKEVAQMPDIRALVLQAEGIHFSAGADLNWMQRMASVSHEENVKDATRLADLMDALDTLPVPTIAKVQGAAYGGAVGLIACCDIAVASEDSRFALSEIRLGLAPATIAPYVIAAIGKRRCRQLFLTAETFEAKEALSYGLVHEVVPEHHLNHYVDLYLKRILETGPQASRAAKALLLAIDDCADKCIHKHLTSNVIADLRASEEGRQGVNAFLNKQTPPWISRA